MPYFLAVLCAGSIFRIKKICVTFLTVQESQLISIMTNTAAVHTWHNYINIHEQKHNSKSHTGKCQLCISRKRKQAETKNNQVLIEHFIIILNSHWEPGSFSFTSFPLGGCVSRVHESPLVWFSLPQWEEKKRNRKKWTLLWSYIDILLQVSQRRK